MITEQPLFLYHDDRPPRPAEGKNDIAVENFCRIALKCRKYFIPLYDNAGCRPTLPGAPYSVTTKNK